MPEIPILLILEDDERIIPLLEADFQGEPVEIMIAKTAAEARELSEQLFERGEVDDIIALDGFAPSEAGAEPSLVGPGLARWLREMGFLGSIIGIASDPGTQELIKEGADWIVFHKTYVCDKRGDHGLRALVRELQGNYFAPSK